MLEIEELEERACRAGKILEKCILCPRECGVDRTSGDRGFCGAGLLPRVAASSVHFGEEPPISGTGGSGNIFFTGCNLGCIFCQNYPISRLGVGRDLSIRDLADAMLRLQKEGVHNINLVSPTPWLPQFLKALVPARREGLTLPVVFNCGGYESLTALQLMEGVVDIYLPDMKYGTDRNAFRFSRAPHYVDHNRKGVEEMLRQVGPLKVDRKGIALQGVLIRHLVLPEGMSETAAVLSSVQQFSPAVPVSLMYQYFPAHQAAGHRSIGRRLWREECQAVEDILLQLRVTEGWKQEYG